jgi:DNA-binding CsgD family transcriptional regulator
MAWCRTNIKRRWSRGTRVFRRTDGGWKLIHQHVSFPYDPATGEARMNLRPPTANESNDVVRGWERNRSLGRRYSKEETLLVITPTERHALHLLARDKTAAELADCLGIEPCELAPYLTSLFSRMGVASPSEAVVSAMQRGLLSADIQPSRS